MKQRQPIASRPEHEVQEAEGRGGSGVVTPTKTESGTWVVTRDIALGRAVPGYDEARGDQP